MLKTRPYKVRPLVSKSMPKRTVMGHLVPTKAFLLPSTGVAMLFAPVRCNHTPPFLLMQNLSPKDIAGSDILKLKASLMTPYESLGRNIVVAWTYIEYM